MAFDNEQQTLSNDAYSENADSKNADNDHINDSSVIAATPIDRVLWQPLPYEVCRVWRQRMWFYDAITAVVVLIGAGVLRNFDMFGPVMMIIAACILALCVVYAIAVPFIVRIRYGFTAFAIDERNIWVRDGWLYRNSQVVPFNKVQIITLSQGPLLRKQGLSAISVHTAFGASEVPALHTAQAKQIVDTVNARVLEAKEDD